MSRTINSGPGGVCEDPVSATVFQEGRLVPIAEARARLRACGRGVKIFVGARLLRPDQVSIGDYSQVDEGVLLHGGEGVVLGRHVHLAFHCSVLGGGACLLGDHVGIGVGVRLVTGTELVDGTGLTNPTVPLEFRAVSRGRIRIGAHALVFTNAVVLPGVTIGEGAVVAAGSVVHQDLKPWGVYAGNPLRQVDVRPSARILELAAHLEATEAAVSASPAQP